MVMKVEELSKALKAFERYVTKFNETLMNKYMLEKNPIHVIGKIVPKSDTIVIDGQHVSYRYHGAGCSVIYGTIQLEFDIIPNESIKITPWKFEQFLITYLKLDNNLFNQDEVYNYLILLEREGLLKKVPYTLGQFELTSY